MNQPSKDWKEVIAPNEDEKFSKYAKIFSIIQKQKSKQFGNGRALHRKQILGMKANFIVLNEIPEFAKVGLFAKAGTYQSIIRLSNGGMEIKEDKFGDIRGFAIRVEGLDSESALGNGKTNSQSFLLINQEAFSTPTSEKFVELVGAVSGGGKSLLKHLYKNHGLFGMFGQVYKVSKTFNKPFSGFATEKFYTAVPISCGEYAVRVRILPSKDETINKNATKDFAKDMKDRLANKSIEFDFQLQFYINDTLTPIEDASINWEEKNSPYYTVARVVIPVQEFESEAAKNFQKEIDDSILDPWIALKEHKPLGDVMRARKYVYLASQKNRANKK